MKNIDEWVEWMTRNPELAEKYYPKIMQGLKERIKRSEPYFTALIIQKLPDHFPNWKKEAEEHFGIKRTKTIQGYIDLINAVLIEYEYPSEIEQKAVESVRAELTEQLEYWNKQIDTRFWLTTSLEEQETIEIKPALKSEAVQVVFNILKDFFSTEQQAELKQIIETGNKASKKLLFKGNGNRLTDTFKKLIEHDFIPGCPKLNLINWIISNFTFTQQNKVKAFIYGTVEKTISRNDNPCKSPLIEIKNGQIQKVEQPRTKKYNKY
jgi:primosomal protein N'